jgi:hypothetical protein
MRARRQLAVVVTVASCLSVTLSGCASAPYDPATAGELQSDVLDVSRAAADGDWAGVSAGLDRVVAEAQQAADAGRIGVDRLESIFAAVAAVRADLRAGSTVSSPPTPSTHHGKGPKK